MRPCLLHTAWYPWWRSPTPIHLSSQAWHPCWSNASCSTFFEKNELSERSPRLVGRHKEAVILSDFLPGHDRSKVTRNWESAGHKPVFPPVWLLLFVDDILLTFKNWSQAAWVLPLLLPSCQHGNDEQTASICFPSTCLAPLLIFSGQPTPNTFANPWATTLTTMPRCKVQSSLSPAYIPSMGSL